MAGPVTQNLGIQLPEVNNDPNVWGTILNDALGSAGGTIPMTPTSFDTEIKRVDDVAAATTIVANAALSRAGGSMTGLLEEHTGILRTVDLGAAPSVVDMNLGQANFFLAQPQAATPTQYVFINVPGLPASASIVFLQILAGGASIVTWDAKIIWSGGAVPALSTTGTDLVGLYTVDGGVTTWYGSLAQRDVR